MEWQPEKMCSSKGEYDLWVERLKTDYRCDHKNDSWKWRIIHSGVILSQGLAHNIESAQKMAESNLPS